MASNQQLTPRLNRLEPNIVIDGGMEIWPEGTSRSVASGSDLYGAVLFRNANDSSSVTLTNSQQDSIPAGTNVPFSNQVSKTASGTLVPGTRTMLRYFVEGYDLNKLLNQEFSVIFWVKSTVAANRSLVLTNGTATHSFVQQYNIASANTWQLQVLKFSALSSCPGTLDRVSGSGLQVRFGIVSGSTFQTSTLNSWVAGNFSSGTGEDTTWLTGTTHDFSIAGVMILPGDWTSLTSNVSSYNFLRAGRNFQDEQSMTQRYYEKSYDSNLSPGAIAGGGSTYILIAQQETANEYRISTRFSVRKRADPVVVTYAPSSATANRVEGAVVEVSIVQSKGETGFTAGKGPGTTLGNQINYQWTADARF